MKKFLSAALTAAALAVASQSAFAIAPNIAPEIEIFMAGASAQDRALRGLMLSLCGKGAAPIGNNGDLDIYTTSGHTAYYCTLTSAQIPGLSVNGAAVTQARVLLHKRSQGGSAQGVNPLIAGTPIAHMPVNVANCPGAAVVGADGQTTTACTAANQNVASHAGLSDVEPDLFIGANVPAGSNPVTSTASITVRPTSALIFGVPVTDALYVVLQKAQGLLPPQGNCQPLQYSEACMPSLTKEAIATLTSGRVDRWSEFKVNYQGVVRTLPEVASDATGGAPTNFTVGGVVKNILPTNLQFHYCKRINGSGTNAAHNVYFLNNPCRTGSDATEGDWASALTNRQMHEVSSAANAATAVNPSDVEACLSDFANGTNIGRQETPGSSPSTFTVVINPTSATAWAIGQQSLENNANLSKNYRFIKINGVAPTLDMVFRGKYEHWVENTCQWRNSASADIRTVVSKICTDFGRPQILAQELNVNFVHPFGASGYLADSNEFAFGDVLNPALPVVPFSHAPDNAKLANCRVPVQSRTYTSVPANKTNRPIRGF